MTAERVRATQAVKPAKSTRLARGVVETVSPLTVRIEGSEPVAGIPVPAAVYTAGASVLVLVQEPLIGPVYPIP